MGLAQLLAWVGLAAFVLAIVAALVLGRKPERIGGAVCIVSALATLILTALSPHKLPYIGILAVDLSVAMAFAWLALKHPKKLWPGAAAVSQTLLVAFSATRAIGFPLSEEEYVAAINVASLGVAVALGAGAVLARRPLAAEESA